MAGRVVVALVIVLAVNAAAGAAPPARTGDLLYLRPLGGNAPPYGRLFVARADGSGARDVTPSSIRDVQGAAWSPDGRRIAISAIAVDDHDPEIFVLAHDGLGLVRLTDNQLSDRQPAWSPDGRSIAFASARTGLFQIYRMRADGSVQRRLTDQAEDCETPDRLAAQIDLDPGPLGRVGRCNQLNHPSPKPLKHTCGFVCSSTGDRRSFVADGR